ncbi:MAG: type IV secretion system DNA-binding domain-containing protein [Candidatus Shapirobacteria bacterium]|nr:type IV secretion system DNA-binding domain-containing protein [Candidatus Shapirobacteria bacterium]
MSIFANILFGLFLIFSFVLLVLILIKLFLFWRKIHSKQIILEILPLRKTEQIPYTTQQLFSLIHGLAKQRSLFQKIIGETKNYSFEIASSKEKGIHYLIRVNKEDASIIKHEILAYLPGMTIKEVDDYLKPDQKPKTFSIVDFTFTKHFAFPLKSQSSLEDHDPIAYITGAMTKMETNEFISFQLVTTPLQKSSIKDIKTFTNLIYNHRELYFNFKYSKVGYLMATVFKLIFLLILNIIFLPVGIMVFVFTEGKEGPFLSSLLSERQKKVDNAYQQELEEQIKSKLDQPLFITTVRLFVSSPSKSNRNLRIKGILASLGSFSNLNYQALIKKKQINFSFIKRLRFFFFKKRLHGLFSNPFLSITEMADIYHLPYTNTTKTEDLVKQQSKELPAPLSLKQSKDLDIYFGQNIYGGTTTKIGLTKDERRRHMYIIGATGVGKSTLLSSMIKQDIDNGKGIAVLDPHGDLIEKILGMIPDERLNEVIYFNPDDIGNPTIINLLELTPDLSEEDSLREKEFIAESIISLFHKIYDDKFSGPRMEYILRNTIYTAFTVPNCTLFTVYKLLSNTPYQKSITNMLDDENLKDFWKFEFGKAGDFQKVQMISPITNKIGRFLFSPTARRILEGPKSSINFDNIMDSGKILLANLSKGRLGEDTSELFGVLLMTKIQLAALKRAKIEEKKRKDFYLYVDEFQNFATPSFAQILSEARKYRLGAILAHQTTSQIEDKSLIDITLANTGTVICFRTANPEDEKLLLPQFYPYVDKGEIASLPSFHFYIKINALSSEEPFSGETIPFNLHIDKNKVKKVIEASRKNYTVAHKISVIKNKIKKTENPVKNINSEDLFIKND